MSEQKTEVTRARRFRRWTQLGVAAAAGLAMTSAGFAAGSGSDHQAIKAKPAGLQVAVATEGGEGGEGKPDGTVEVEAMYLVILGQVEGHLDTAMALYRLGESELARMHAVKPGDALYRELRPKLGYRHADAFDTELNNLAAAMEAGRPMHETEPAFAAVMKEIHQARAHAGGGDHARLMAAGMLVRLAGSDYAQGVKAGKVSALKDYQDAWGYIEAAKSVVTPLKQDANADVARAAARITGELDGLAPAFPELAPRGIIDADAKHLYRAGARIILAAQSVK